MRAGRHEPLRVVHLHGVPCAECGQSARSMTVFADHITTTHDDPRSGYCVTVGALERRQKG